MEQGRSAPRSDAWRFQPRAWMLLLGFTAALSAGALCVFPPGGTLRLAVAWGALVSALLVMVVLARRLARETTGGDGPALVVILLWSGILIAAPSAWVAIAPVSMMVYSTATRRSGHLSSALFAVSGTVGILTTQAGPALATRGAFAAVAVTYSLGLAWWISGIVTESHERKELLRQLAETRTELAETNHERGILAERQRVARDIHDTLAQGFISVRMLVEAASATLERDPGKAGRCLDLARRQADENHAQARALVTEGSTGQLESSLPQALHRLTDGLWEQETDIRVTGETRTLRAMHEVTLLRLAQEAVANVRKHARATRVEIELEYGHDQVSLEVRDDGVGFDPTENRVAGLGVTGMRDRLTELGGDLELWSRPGCGTRVTVRV